MVTYEWIALIRREFGVSKNFANAMFHTMIKYYKTHEHGEVE